MVTSSKWLWQLFLAAKRNREFVSEEPAVLLRRSRLDLLLSRFETAIHMLRRSSVFLTVTIFHSSLSNKVSIRISYAHFRSNFFYFMEVLMSYCIFCQGFPGIPGNRGTIGKRGRPVSNARRLCSSFQHRESFSLTQPPSLAGELRHNLPSNLKERGWELLKKAPLCKKGWREGRNMSACCSMFCDPVWSHSFLF